ncbi:3'-5' exonuclease [Egicoccus sp. AB-alg2]|uniref:3'-5' exonuclease n=1 Tax=Egicoccus sp. AB-alg2 TaxID=3242693 RepID=UPI00359D3962
MTQSRAIYAFRGADVHAYLQAVRIAERRRTLGTSWRADAGLLKAFRALFDGVAFGHPEIAHRPVDAAPGHDAPRFRVADHPEPLRLRVVPRYDAFRIWENKPNADQVRDLIARDLAADVVRLLSTGTELVDRDRDGREVGRRAVVPGDVAVLVRSHVQASLVQDTLQTIGVPAVVGGAGSVFATPAATAWRRLLDALERPAAASRVRALALTLWVGWTADGLAGASGNDWDRLHDEVNRWAHTLSVYGVATTFRSILLQRDVRRRLLAVEGGERLLADLEHIAELAHAAATGEHLGTAGLVTWFRDRCAEAGREGDDDRLRRLETDRDAVQIMTIHGSKGLEFPVVFCPFLWSSSASASATPVFHDADGTRLLDVGGSGDDTFGAHVATAEEEARGEELRLLYVAMTRAKHQVVAWYAPAGVPEWSGLGRVLLCRDGDGVPDCDQPAPLPGDAEILAALDAVAAGSDGTIAVETVPPAPASDRWEQEPVAEVALDRARFTRTLDQTWRRTSYSALTALDVDDPRVGSEPDERVKDDEPAPDLEGEEDHVPTGEPVWADAHGLREVTLPLAELPGGRHVGTFVHGVLEHTDFAAADLDAALSEAVAGQLRRRRLDLDTGLLVAGLRAVLETPLGDSAGGLALRDVGLRDRQDEMAFELPLDRAGGDPATVGDLVGLLREHLPADDPLAGYPDAVPTSLLDRPLRGFLGGFIDLVVRRRGAAGDVFHVIDYKTNRLGVWGEPLTAFDYRQEALADAMTRTHYPVQALLYAVAAHRMLRWRLGEDYDPATNLGSVLYLFLRGMAGPETPAPDGRPCGVFAWSPPTSLITTTSDLLHGVPV